MRHVLTAVVTAIEAAAIAIASLSILVFAAILLTVFTFSLNVDLMEVAHAVAATWGLAHSVPLTVTLDPATALSFGLRPTELSFVISLTPLALGGTTAALAARLAWRIRQPALLAALTTLAATLGFATAATALLWFAGDIIDPPLWSAALIATAWFAVPAWLTYLVRQRDPLAHRWFRLRVRVESRTRVRLGWTLEQLMPRALKLATATLAAIIALAATAFFAGLVLGYADYMSLSQALQLDIVGVIIVTLVQFTVLPNLIIWALAWLSGPGFALGSGSSLTPFDILVGPVPSLPIFATVPDAWGEWGLLAPITVVVAAGVVGYVFAGRAEMKHPPAWKSLTVAVLAALFVGAAIALLALVAGGSLGPGRLHDVGPELWPVTLTITGEVAAGLMLAVAARRLPTGTGAMTRPEPELVELTTAPGVGAAGTTGEPGESEEQGTQGAPGDTQETQRIIDPEATRPWFHRAQRTVKKPPASSPPVNVTPVIDPTLDEEELLREYSWEAEPEQTRNDDPVH